MQWSQLESAACGFSPDWWGITLGSIARRYENWLGHVWSAQLRRKLVLLCFIGSIAVFCIKRFKAEVYKIRPHVQSHAMFSLRCGRTFLTPWNSLVWAMQSPREQKGQGLKRPRVPTASTSGLASCLCGCGWISLSLTPPTLVNSKLPALPSVSSVTSPRNPRSLGEP